MSNKFLEKYAREFVITVLAVTNSNWKFICEKWKPVLEADLTDNIEAKLQFGMAVTGLGLSKMRKDISEDNYVFLTDGIRFHLNRVSGNLGDEPWRVAKKYQDAYEKSPNFESKYAKPPLEDNLEAIGILLQDSFERFYLIKFQNAICYSPLTLMVLSGSVALVLADCRKMLQNIEV